jgi:heme/copper-type cytochrome/quinol oxidase subunit 2
MKAYTRHIPVLALIVLASCGQSQQFTAVPPNARNEDVPHYIVHLKAEKFKFTPDVVRVKVGTLVQIEITSDDGTHGFQLGAYGIDERIEENQTKIIEFYASKRGEYSFRCSHFCGIGHLGMSGKVIVE